LESGRIAARNKGIQFGRTKGSVETEKDFYTKPKVIQILKYLEKGEHTIREIALLSESSTFLVQKVLKKEKKKQLNMFEAERLKSYEEYLEKELSKDVNKTYVEGRERDRLV
jgi:DNA invertase Pin-like site-specific DNA recombinase